MKTQNLELLGITEYGVPSGNYDGSSTSFYSDRVEGVGFYRLSTNSQTVRFRSDDFVGLVTVQATLDTDPVSDGSGPRPDADWFDVYEFPGDSAVDGSTAITTDYSITLDGNFTWLRAKVQYFEGGTVGPITLSY